MTAVEVLTAARALIATPEQWTRLALARAADGREVVPTDPTATCRCSFGALFAAAPDYDHLDALDQASMILKRANGIDSIPPWNDAPGRTHGEILAGFDRAIAAADEGETP